MLEITVFGASDSVGKSCLMISDKDHHVIIDAGIQLHPRKTRMLSTPPEGVDVFAPELTALLLSHAHIDHSAYIPALYRAGYKGLTYMTTPTRDILQILWKDHLKIEGPHHYGVSDMHKAQSKISIHKYNKKFKIADGITAEFYNASHILGSSSILIDWEGTRIFYSGDFNNAKTPFHDPMVYPDPDNPIDILLIETTNADRQIASRKVVTSDLTKSLLKCYARGGKAIIPSFALGRSQEIQAYLMNDFDSFLHKFPLYVDGMILEMNEIYRKYLTRDWVSQRILLELKDKGLTSPFDHDGIHSIDEISPHGKRIKKREMLSHNQKSHIALTTSGMLEGGPVYDYLRYHAGSKLNGLYVVGYQVEGTVGHQIVSGDTDLVLDDGFGDVFEVQLNLEIKQFEFSGHASLEGLLEMVRYTHPKKIIALHGEPSAQQTFSESAMDNGYETSILVTREYLPEYP
ncbi:MAG: hypothetical protein EAX86_00730 [Candidatus Heimdallarchaeota archaeon]|nr:hypothetical protein [Candidatus Heimdallarchaeota archaeon]